jgi:putative thioredoxin
MFNFKKEVIDASFQKPILVDFWAPWCGPCRVLGPTLEALAEEQKDRWALVKINTEEQQQLAAEYGIRSIPNVKLFSQGKVVAEFAGALPKAQVERWLDEHLPNPSAQALGSILKDEGPWPDSRLVQPLQAFSLQNPDNKEARLALAKHSLLEDADAALQLVNDIVEGDEWFDQAEDLRAIASLMAFEKSNGAAAGKHLADARSALLNGQQELAIEKIIDAVMADKNYHGDLPRKAAIALFHLWGPQHELTRSYRRMFDMALY